MKIAINGYGRIGRCIVWAIYENGLQDDIQIVAINDLADNTILAHLTRHDSTHGAFKADVQLSPDNNTMNIDGNDILMLTEKDPLELPWDSLDVDIVFECTGLFKHRAQSEKHLQAGARKVLLSHPSVDADLTVVYGVNHQKIQPEHQIISNASCTTNCLAPLVKVINDKVGIEQGMMTTIHAYTNDQTLVDRAHSDPYRARSATQSMIPTMTGAAAAVGLVLPELVGKLDGVAVRVPTVNVSLVDFQFIVNHDTTRKGLNRMIKEAAMGDYKGIISYNKEALVSIDYNHNSASSIFDSLQTRVLGKQCKVMSWYDNEWGFSNRMLDVAKLMV